jgi:hypothetical protein
VRVERVNVASSGRQAERSIVVQRIQKGAATVLDAFEERLLAERARSRM